MKMHRYKKTTKRGGKMEGCEKKEEGRKVTVLLVKGG